MIREYAPIPLIPAAWALTFATLVYPGIDTYWIQHMHYFMVLFLGGFTVLSWKKMGEDSVLDIWRKIIALGTVFTGLGALSFITTDYSSILGYLSFSYWFLAPGIGLYASSRHMNNYSKLYRQLGGESVIGFVLILLGLYTDSLILQIIGIVGIAVVQTISIVTASKLDSNDPE